MFTLAFWIALAGRVVTPAAEPPAVPTITEPTVEWQSVHAADVHMATAPFHDPDGDGHRCSDWAILDSGGKAVWTAPCVTGAARVHIHLGDGTFAEGKPGLDVSMPYLLRVRHCDDGPVEGEECSGWAERHFVTGPATLAAPFVLRETGRRPPEWRSTAGTPIVIPDGAVARLETVDGETLLSIRSGAVDARIVAPGAVVRLALHASGPWSLPPSDLLIEDAEGNRQTLYLPAVDLAAGERRLFWISSNGSTFPAQEEDRDPQFTLIARASPLPWTVAVPGFRVDRFAEDLRLPVHLAFASHPSAESDAPWIYVTELYGAIKVVTRSGEVRDFATGLLNFDPEGPFPGSGEYGLAGIVVEPRSGDVIVAVLYRPFPDDPRVYPRIVRLSSVDGGRTANAVTTILDLPAEEQAPSHQISNLSIGPDGKLYVHLGDVHNPELARDLRTARGKILRIDLDGSAPQDNPFYDLADGLTATDYIFALGFRNPFGGAWRAADLALYEVENGPATDRLARVERGRDYLWDGSDESMRNFAICNFPGGTAPVDLDFVQKETFSGSGFPEAWLDRAFVSESGPTWASGPTAVGKRIESVSIRPDGTLASGPSPFVTYDGTGKATVSGIAAGPDGIYFSSLYRDQGFVSPTDRGAAVFRVRWVGTADFSARIVSDLEIALTDLSDVPDAAEWSWDFGDGQSSSERNPTHRYVAEGTYLLRLAVTGPRGEVVRSRKIDVRREGGGLEAEYFDDFQMTMPRVRNTAGNIDVRWRLDETPPGVESESFAVRWRGRIRGRRTETVRLSLQTLQPVRLAFDGVTLIDRPAPAADAPPAVEVAMEAGRLYDLVVEYVRTPGPASIRLLWESDTQPLEVVPPAVLYPPSSVRQRSAGR